MKTTLLAATLFLNGFILTNALAQTTTLPAVTQPTYHAPPSTTPARQSVLPKELATAIQNGIDLLKADKVKEAIQSLVSPDDITKIKADDGFDKMVEQFISSGHSKALLQALQTAQNQPSTSTDDGNTISFAPQADNPPLVFHLIKNGWYIR